MSPVAQVGAAVQEIKNILPVSFKHVPVISCSFEENESHEEQNNQEEGEFYIENDQ